MWHFLQGLRLVYWFSSVRREVNIRIIFRYSLSILPRIPSFRKGVFYCSLRHSNLEDFLLASLIAGMILKMRKRFNRVVRDWQGRREIEGQRVLTTRSLARASKSPYPASSRFRSYFSVANRFRSLTQTHHKECRSSQDLCRNSSTDHARPEERDHQHQLDRKTKEL